MIACFEYKCRRCGVVVTNTSMGASSHSDTRPMLTLLDALDATPKEGQSPRMNSVHLCGIGEYGVTDLIGYRITKD